MSIACSVPAPAALTGAAPAPLPSRSNQARGGWAWLGFVCEVHLQGWERPLRTGERPEPGGSSREARREGPPQTSGRKREHNVLFTSFCPFPKVTVVQVPTVLPACVLGDRRLFLLAGDSGSPASISPHALTQSRNTHHISKTTSRGPGIEEGLSLLLKFPASIQDRAIPSPRHQAPGG